MQRLTLSVSLFALFLASLAVLGVRLPAGPAAAAGSHDSWSAIRNYPPLVVSSTATLDCSISSTKPGRQVMTTVGGQGFTFDAPMKPIDGGKVKLQGSGMHYEFNSFPTHEVTATFSGIGSGRITSMKTEVAVDVARFSQPGGPGTNIHFTASDIDPNGAYVEFTGVFVRDRDNKPFPFRVLFGHVTAGGGDVTPSGPGVVTGLMQKRVALGTRSNAATVITALYEAEDDVLPLR